MLKVAVELPAGIVTVAGSVTSPLFELSETEIPPAGAVPLMPTVPVADPPPVTDPGEAEIK